MVHSLWNTSRINCLSVRIVSDATSMVVKCEDFQIMGEREKVKSIRGWAVAI